MLPCRKRKSVELPLGTWNTRSIKMGKLNTVKDEMTRLHIDNLGISKLKWTGIGHLQSENHTVYYLGHKKQRRVVLKVRKDIARTVPGYSEVSDQIRLCRLNMIMSLKI